MTNPKHRHDDDPEDDFDPYEDVEIEHDVDVPDREGDPNSGGEHHRDRPDVEGETL